MAHIRERNGKFATTLKIGRQTLYKTFDTREEAIIWEAQQKLALKRGDSDVIFTKEKFADITIAYLNEVTPVKRGAKNEEIIIKRLLREDWVNMKLGKLTSGHLAEYRDKRLETLKASTFKREWSLIRSIAKFGHYTLGINLRLAMFNDLKLPRVFERRVERITPAQEERLLETARLAGNRVKYMVPFINLALATAMRRGELCSLAWDDVDMENRRIYIPASKAKSGHSRTIPMTDRAFEALSQFALLQRKRPLKYVIGRSGNAIRLAFGRIRKLAGLDHIRIHDFRHEAISRFHEAGLTLPEIQSISGHAELEMLARYSHASTDNLLPKIAKIGGVK